MAYIHYKKEKIPDLKVSGLTSQVTQRFSNIVANSGITDFSPTTKVFTSDKSNRSLSYFSHGIFRFFGKFPPPIARYLIKTFTNPNDLIVDPMCGSGTSALEALLLHRKAECFDINDLCVLISRVKVTHLNKEKFMNYLHEVLRLTPNDSESSQIYKPVGLRKPEHWFFPETTKSLAKIKQAIDKLEAPRKFKDALQLAFLATVRPVSKATTQQGRLFLDVESAKRDATVFFENKAKEIIQPLSLLPKNNGVNITQKSVLSNNELVPQKTKLVICHPPYFTAYRYSRVNSLELAWLGVDHSELRKDEIREAFKLGKPEKVHNYVEDMERALRNLNNYLLPRGRLALMIGDTMIKGSYIPVTRMLINKVSDIYDVEYSALRVPRFTEASWVASQRRDGNKLGINLCDFIVILRKK